MKRKMTSFFLAAALLVSLLPPTKVLAAYRPSGFLVPVTQELPAYISSGLYDEPEITLPDASESDFLLSIEGGEPYMPAAGVMTAAGEAAAGAVEISTREELAAMSAGGTYVLTKDIDLSDEDWTPLDFSARNSTLVLDGGGHTIRGLTLRSEASAHCGLIGEINGTLTVKNLRLDATVHLSVTQTPSTTLHGTGALCGYASGKVTLQNVTADVSVERTGACELAVGGLVGRCDAVSAKDTAVRLSAPKAETTFDGGIYAAYFGGIAGYVYRASSVSHSYASTKIDLRSITWTAGDYSYLGGMFGYSASGLCSFEDCLAEGELFGVATGVGSRTGGLVGYASGAVSAENCVCLADASGVQVGGFVGYTGGNNAEGSFSYSRYAGALAVSGGITAYCGGFAGRGAKSTFVACASRPTVSVSTTGTSYVGGLSGETCVSVTSCEIDMAVETPSKLGGTLYMGGAVGRGAPAVTDTLVSLDAPSLLSAGEVRIGGILGAADGTLSIRNCGAEVDIGVTSERKVAYIGGIVGSESSSGVSSYVRCHTAGALSLTYVADASVLYLGGIGGSITGAMTQCYSEVDIHTEYTSTVGSGSIGGLAGGGTSAYSCWADGSITGSGQAYVTNVGGLIGETNGTFRDCAFLGSFGGIWSERLGGIAGAAQLANFYNCYTLGNFKGGRHVGGILGYGSHKLVFENCKFTGSCTALSGGGASGMSALGTGTSSFGVAELRNCVVEANMYAPGGNAYGVCRGQANAENCTFRGLVSGANMCGIAASGSFYDCSAEVTLLANQGVQKQMAVGGIACSTATAVRCSVLAPLSLSVSVHEDVNELTLNFGGIAGTVYSAADCEVKGISVRAYGNDHALDETVDTDVIIVSVGGLAGKLQGGLDDCTVAGGVSADVTYGRINAGGVAGSAAARSFIDGCTVRGGVSAHLRDSIVYAGSLLGLGTDTTGISGCISGSVSASCTAHPDSVHTEHEWVGNGQFVYGGGSVNQPERPEEQHAIYTYYYLDDLSSSAIVPLDGVTITVNGSVVGETENGGLLSVSRAQIGSLSMEIEGEKKGYFSAHSFSTFSSGGHTNLYLMEKTKGKIYFTAAEVVQEDAVFKREKRSNILYDQNKVSVLQSESDPLRLYFGVDWNDADEVPRTLQLNNKAGNKPLPASEGICLLAIQSHFDPKDDIYLEAIASFGGETVTQRVRLGLEVLALRPELPIQGGEVDFTEVEAKEKAPYFLRNSGFKLDLGDLMKFCNDVKIENDTLVLTFRPHYEDNAESKISLFNDSKLDVSVIGEYKIPIYDFTAAEWSGSIAAGVNRKPEYEGPISMPDNFESETLEWVYEHIAPPAIPLMFKLGLDIGAKAGLGIRGKYGENEYFGHLTGEGEGKIFIGLGRSAGEKVEVSGGGEGRLAVKLPLIYTVEENVQFEPELSGGLYAVFTFKVGELVQLDVEAKMGGFKWNEEDGTVWDSIWDDETAQLAWVASDRAYTENGGGFLGDAPAAELFAWEDAPIGEKKRLLYENISADSNAALTLEGETPVLYFTADDGTDAAEGLMAEHTSLWRSRRQSDGTWSLPERVSSEDGGYPAAPYASGSYAVWVESAETGSLDTLLTSTDIKIAKDGVPICSVDGGGYVYAPRITADANGNVLAAWLFDPALTADTLFTSDTATLCYAKYEAATQSWSSGTAKALGTPTDVFLADGNVGQIFTLNADGEFAYSHGTDFGSVTKRFGGIDGAFTSIGTHSAMMSDSGVITVWSGASQLAQIETGSELNSELVLAQDGSDLFVLWGGADGVSYARSSDGWTLIHELCVEEGIPSRMAAVIKDERPLTTYYRVQQSGESVSTNLLCALAEDISGADLAVSDAVFDSRDVASSGAVRLEACVTNRMDTVQSGYSYEVVNENGTAVAIGTKSVQLKNGESDVLYVPLASDLTAAHSYTLTVTPAVGTDADMSDNTAELSTKPMAMIDAAFFRKTPDGVGIEVLLGNAGLAPAEDLTLCISKAGLSGAATGEVLLTKEIERVLPGSFEQVLLPVSESDTYYLAELYSGETLLSSKLLLRTQRPASEVKVESVSVDALGASVTLSARNYDEDVQLWLALYQNGQLRAAKTLPLSAWDGETSVTLGLDGVAAGSYDCSVFLLERQELTPLTAAFSKTVTVAE